WRSAEGDGISPGNDVRLLGEDFLLVVVVIIVVDVGRREGGLLAAVVVRADRDDVAREGRHAGHAGAGARRRHRDDGAVREEQKGSEEPEKPHPGYVVQRARLFVKAEPTLHLSYSARPNGPPAVRCDRRTFAIFRSRPSRSKGFGIRGFGTRFKKSAAPGSSMPPVMKTMRAAMA